MQALPAWKIKRTSLRSSDIKLQDSATDFLAQGPGSREPQAADLAFIFRGGEGGRGEGEGRGRRSAGRGGGREDSRGRSAGRTGEGCWKGDRGVGWRVGM